MFTFNLLLTASLVLIHTAHALPASSPATLASTITKVTPFGVASGVLDSDGAYRFSVKYANAARWAPSTVVNSWKLPTGAKNASDLPLACPQNFADPSTFNEDCLSMILYVPPTFNMLSSAPTLVWVHGGSFIIGSATAPGLDGSKLAIATNSIVAVIQYRLGALGYMAPNKQTNLPLKDVINALKFLNMVLPSFGGNPSKITLAGQSSGASLIRALLGVPSASSLFKSAILQSDPVNFGLFSKQTQATLLSFFVNNLGCGTSSSCLNQLSLDTILGTELNLLGSAASLDPAAGISEPIRPVFDGSFVTNPMDSSIPFPKVNKPLIITSVKDDAAFAIYGGNPDPLSAQDYQDACTSTFGPARAAVILKSPFYQFTPALGTTDARGLLQTLGTDYLWRCSGWTLARSWVKNGGTAYVGQYVVGSSYPGNEQVPICTQPGVVCHQDDIQIVFGTAPSPSPAQSALITQMQARYKAFLATGNPNAPGVPTWSPAGTSDVRPLVLGGPGQVAVGACTPTFWGASAQYDYQFFNE